MLGGIPRVITCVNNGLINAVPPPKIPRRPEYQVWESAGMTGSAFVLVDEEVER